MERVFAPVEETEVDFVTDAVAARDTLFDLDLLFDTERVKVILLRDSVPVSDVELFPENDEEIVLDLSLVAEPLTVRAGVTETEDVCDLVELSLSETDKVSLEESVDVNADFVLSAVELDETVRSEVELRVRVRELADSVTSAVAEKV